MVGGCGSLRPQAGPVHLKGAVGVLGGGWWCGLPASQPSSPSPAGGHWSPLFKGLLKSREPREGGREKQRKGWSQAG